MTSAFIIHGYGTTKDSHWFPWLKQKLEEQEVKVFLPQFPIGKGQQTLENWLNALKPMADELPDSIMIGHSLGVPFILNVLNSWDVKIRAAFLVAGFGEKLEAEELTQILPEINKFVGIGLNWHKIRNSCKAFCVIHSNNDPLVPFKKAQMVAKNLNAPLVMVEGAGHFKQSDGYDKFELLLKKIDEVL